MTEPNDVSSLSGTRIANQLERETPYERVLRLIGSWHTSYYRINKHITLRSEDQRNLARYIAFNFRPDTNDQPVFEDHSAEAAEDDWKRDQAVQEGK